MLAPFLQGTRECPYGFVKSGIAPRGASRTSPPTGLCKFHCLQTDGMKSRIAGESHFVRTSHINCAKAFAGVWGRLLQKRPRRFPAFQKGGRDAAAPRRSFFCHFIFCTIWRIFFPVFSIASAVFLAMRLALLLITTPIAPATDAAVRIPAAIIVVFFIFSPPLFSSYYYFCRAGGALYNAKSGNFARNCGFFAIRLAFAIKILYNKFNYVIREVSHATDLYHPRPRGV